MLKYQNLGRGGMNIRENNRKQFGFFFFSFIKDELSSLASTLHFGEIVFRTRNTSLEQPDLRLHLGVTQSNSSTKRSDRPERIRHEDANVRI